MPTTTVRTKESLINLFHAIFTADTRNDLEDTIAAIEGVMERNNIQWKDDMFEVAEKARSVDAQEAEDILNRYYSGTVYTNGQEAVIKYFKYAVNTEAMAKNRKQFAQLCDYCMSF